MGYKLTKKIMNWVHENPNDEAQIRIRAMIIAASPVFIGAAIGMLIGSLII